MDQPTLSNLERLTFANQIRSSAPIGICNATTKLHLFPQATVLAGLPTSEAKGTMQAPFMVGVGRAVTVYPNFVMLCRELSDKCAHRKSTSPPLMLRSSMSISLITRLSSSTGDLHMVSRAQAHWWASNICTAAPMMDHTDSISLRLYTFLSTEKSFEPPFLPTLLANSIARLAINQ